MLRRCSCGLRNSSRNYVSYSSAILTNDAEKNGFIAEATVPPRHARVVICGGGVMGAAVAYNLAKLGWGPETVLVEQNRIGGGTTWHSSGLIGVFKPSLTQVKLTQSSVALYEELDLKGFSTGWKQCGSLNVARTVDRMIVFKRMKAQSV